MKTFLCQLILGLIAILPSQASGSSMGTAIGITANEFADTTQLFIQDAMANSGDTVCMSVHVSDFQDIIGFQFVVHFDPFLLQFDSITNLHPDINPNVIHFGLSLADEGKIIVIYFVPFNGLNLPDSSTLFDVCFRVTGAPGEISPVNIGPTGISTGIEISNSNLELVYPMIDNGMLNITDPGDYQLHQRICSSTPGDISGSAEVQVFGGNPPYLLIYVHQTNPQFSGGVGLDTFGRKLTIPGLLAGTYDVSVTDEDGLRITDQFLISTANELDYDLVLTGPSCAAIPDGAIEIDNISGWVPPVYIEWFDAQLFLEKKEDLISGSYGFTITDGGGCTMEQTIVLEDNGPRVVADIQLETCTGTGDGSLLISGTGGLSFADSTYIFDIGGMPIRDTFFLIDSIGEGAYPVAITDSLGCIYYDTVHVGPGRFLSARNSVITQPSCHGDTSGRIEVLPLSLAGDERKPYSFSWSPGISDPLTTDSSSIVEILPAGQYGITITDSGDVACVFDTIFTIIQPEEITMVELDTRTESCVPGTDGYIQIDVNGGTVPDSLSYFVLWQNGDKSLTSDSLATGDYRVTVIDDNNCIAKATFTLPAPQAPLITGFVSTDQNCADTFNGSAQVLFTLGSTPLSSVLWNNGDTGAMIGPVGPGEYIVIVRDQNQCSDVDTVIIQTAQGPVITGIDSTLVSCADDSSASLRVWYQAGNSGIVSVSWSNGQDGDSIRLLAAGTYTVSILDDNQCVAIDSASLSIPVSPEIDLISISDPLCKGQSNGSIRIDVIPGNGQNPSLLWSTGDSTLLITQLEEGLYRAIASNERGCADTLRVQLFDPDGFSVQTSQIRPPSCPGDSDGSLEISILPDPPGQYDILWSTADTSSRISGLSPDIYSVTITDQNDCTDSLSIALPEPDTVKISVLHVSEINCLDSLGGEISIDISPGSTENYHIRWSDGDTTETIAGLAAGVYAVTATSQEGCTDSIEVELTEPREISLELIEAIQPVCEDSLSGQITVAVFPADITDYSINWSDGSEGETNSGLKQGEYSVTATSSRLCTDSLQITLNAPHEVMLLLTSVQDPSCSGLSNGSVGLEVVLDSSVTFDITWSDGSSGTENDSLTAGEYTASIMTEQMCRDTISVTLTDPPLLSLTLSSVPDSIGLMKGQASVIVDGGTPPYQYQWNSQPPQSDSIATSLGSGIYTVTVTDAAGCQHTDSVFVDELTAVSSDPAVESFSIYPVPAGSTLYFDLDLRNATDVQWRLINLHGAVLYENFSNDEALIRDRISIKDFNSGIYYLEWSVEGRKHINKLVII